MLSVIGCKATSQGLNITGKWLSRTYCWVGNREKRSRKWGKHPAYLLSSLSGTFSQVHQRGRFDWGRPSCPPSPVGCPSGLCCPPARWPPSTHCVFRAIGLAPCQRCGQLPVQLTGRHDHGGRLHNSQTSKTSKVLSTLILLSLSPLKLL